MSASAGPTAASGRPTVAGTADARRLPKPRGERFGGLVEGWLRGHTLLIYLFLYIPIIVVVIFSFNATNRRVTDWVGFNLKWEASVLLDEGVQSALTNNFILATITGLIPTVFGEIAALLPHRAPDGCPRPL